MDRSRKAFAAAVRPFAPGERLLTKHMPAFNALADALSLPVDGDAPPAPAKSRLGTKTLAAVLGSATAAAALFVSVPAHESGRKVEATVQPTGEVNIRHISGKQYLKAYLDIVKVPTICDGITRNVKLGQAATEAECAAMLEAELVRHAEPVIACVPKLYGKPNQAAASVSLAYNIGTAGFCKSTAARRFNAGDWRGGCDAFLMWNKAGGKVVAGLDRRRREERALCLTDLPKQGE